MGVGALSRIRFFPKAFFPAFEHDPEQDVTERRRA